MACGERTSCVVAENALTESQLIGAYSKVRFIVVGDVGTDCEFFGDAVSGYFSNKINKITK